MEAHLAQLFPRKPVASPEVDHGHTFGVRAHAPTQGSVQRNPGYHRDDRNWHSNPQRVRPKGDHLAGRPCGDNHCPTHATTRPNRQGLCTMNDSGRP